MGGLIRGWLIGPLVLLSIVAFLFRADIHRAFEAVLIVQDLLPGVGESWLDQTGPAPRKRDLAFAVDGRTHKARVIGDGAPLVLLPGADMAGEDHPLFAAFADTLAKAGFQVLIPEMPRMRRLELRAADARIVADAVRHLGEADSRRVGIAAISFAVGPALLAAMEPDAAGHVDYVAGIGGYYDARALITFLATGFHKGPDEDHWRHREPAPYAKWAFLKANAELLGSPQDRATLYALADGALSTAAAEPRLGSEGKAVLAVFGGGRSGPDGGAHRCPAAGGAGRNRRARSAAARFVRSQGAGLSGSRPRRSADPGQRECRPGRCVAARTGRPNHPAQPRPRHLRRGQRRRCVTSVAGRLSAAQGAGRVVRIIATGTPTSGT